MNLKSILILNTGPTQSVWFLWHCRMNKSEVAVIELSQKKSVPPWFFQKMSVNLLRTTEFQGVLILKIPLSDKNFDGIPGEERKKTMENSRGLMKILMEFYSFVLKMEN